MNRRAFLQSLLAILPAPLVARLPFTETVDSVEAVAPVVDDYWQLGLSGASELDETIRVRSIWTAPVTWTSGELITMETLNAQIGDNLTWDRDS